ncbi:transglutaminase family protein [Actimicrobium sp. CCI2.3]|uniref:transglutaminase-like domain-containing protein n=1 Tax=Actimicrobium sp. CCI2.3 TaxID=3048616 RepID=UPI002AB3C64C|nr:transglutaminase family protein [Actimicrobium sp. CCI2.3]MDY7574565.1 transglutaminase family protein [Actimicrobium sp. CCI2.3]MEB0020941.1 transglutaminase family protein [Actimicrobium sp. CCI2.3]
MIRLNFSIELNYDIYDRASDFIFNIHAATTAHQQVVREQLHVSQDVRSSMFTMPETGSRYLRLQAHNGPLCLRYEATVELNHHVEAPANLQEMAIDEVPPHALTYIYPSRYCQADRLHNLSSREFGGWPRGYQRVLAIQQWIRQRMVFQSGSTNASTSALDTLLEQVGVCRDYAHLMIALCRAVNMPARFVTGIDYGVDQSMRPLDFHAYVEVMLSGRWYLFDPSGVSPPMGLVRIGTGRDAVDVPFATVFGAVSPALPLIRINAVEDAAQGLIMPFHTDQALSSAMV